MSSARLTDDFQASGGVHFISHAVTRALGARGCMFTFHRVASSRDWSALPNREFYVSLEFIDTLLTYLKRTGRRVVSVEEMISVDAAQDKGLVNFSIDDCYVDTCQSVVPLFRSHGVPITLYVTTGVPDGTVSLSWAGLETVLLRRDFVQLGDRRLDVSTFAQKRAAYASIWREWEAGQSAALYDAFCRDNGFDSTQLQREHAIDWQMLQSIDADAHVEIGAHTMSHARLSKLSLEDAEAEIKGSIERLQEKLNRTVRHFAFPYGRRADCGPREAQIVRDLGLASAATTRKGLVGAKPDVYSLPRNTLNGAHQSLALIEASLCGLSGALARVLGRV